MLYTYSLSQCKEHKAGEQENTYTRYVVVSTDTLCQQPVSDLPGKYRRTLSFVLRDPAHHFWCGYSGLAPSDSPWTDWPCLVIPAQNFAHTSIGDLKSNHTQPPLSCQTVFSWLIAQREWVTQIKVSDVVYSYKLNEYFNLCTVACRMYTTTQPHHSL